MSKEISREEFDKLVSDVILIKNDVNTIMANTQISANISSLVNYDKIKDIVFKTANNSRLCKALIICKTPTSSGELANQLGIKPQNINRDIVNKLKSLLTRIDDRKNIYYQRVQYLDLIGFDELAIKSYPELEKT